EADIRIRVGVHGQACALAGRADEEESGLHLDDRLADGPGVEVPGGPPSEALETGRDRGHVLGLVPGKSATGAHEETVDRQHHGLAGGRDPPDEIVEEPVESVARPRHCSSPSGTALLPLSAAVASAARRPRFIPDWNEAIIARNSSGERVAETPVGFPSTGPADPRDASSRSCAARLVCRTRLGKPSRSPPD